MTNGWTPERRRRQSEAISRWKPWRKSTGPQSQVGKSIVSRNAYKGSVRPVLRAIASALRRHRVELERLEERVDES